MEFKIQRADLFVKGQPFLVNRSYFFFVAFGFCLML